jgi:hypothetical protein
MGVRSLRVAGACCALLLGSPCVASATVFGPQSFWNKPLSATAPRDPNSSRLVAALDRQVSSYGSWVNTSRYSSPVYTVPKRQPAVRVVLDTTAPVLQADFDDVPLPANATPAAGGDHHLTVYQPSTDSLWEFWLLSRQPDGWHARWGGKMTGVSTSPGYFPSPYGATATSLPLLGGLMRTKELAAHRIDHALAIGVPDVRAGTFVWPAQRTDGASRSPASIPEGTRLRLPASLDLDALRLAPATRAMARAVQRYGMVVRDRAGSVVFYAEDATPSGAWPYGSIFGTPWLDGRNALRGFPWARLEVVAPPRFSAARGGSSTSRGSSARPAGAARGSDAGPRAPRV